MKMHHTRYYWITVALVIAALLLTITEAHGQTAGAAAVFEGRPALAGAQGGQGAQAGMPQGGIGVQGNEAAERGLRLRKPSLLDEVRRDIRGESVEVAAAPEDAAPVAADVGARKEVEPTRDRSLAKDERSSVKKGKRAAKRTISRSRHGVGEIDSASAAKGQ